MTYNASNQQSVYHLVGTTWTEIAPPATNYKADICVENNILYYTCGEGVDPMKLYVYKYEESVWSAVGSSINNAGSGVAYYSTYPIITASSGKIFVGYQNNPDRKVHVQKYDGTWTSLGQAESTFAGTQGTTGYYDLVSYAGTPYVITHTGKIQKYNGSSWVSHQTFPASSSNYVFSTMTPDGKIAIFNSQPSSGSRFVRWYAP